MIGIAIANSLGLNKLSGINPDAQAFITAAGITGATEISAVNALVNGLQSDGLWSKMKAVYPFVTDNRNLLSYTEDFTNAFWSTGATRTANTTIAPNGTTTADTIVFSSNQQLYNNTTRTSGIYNFSLYVKKGTNRYFAAQLESATIAYRGIFDFDTLTVTNTTANTTASISDAGSGWFRVSVTNTTTDVITYTTVQAASSGTSITGGAGTYYLWGAQLELGSTATTYQPIATTQQAYIASQFKYNLKDPRDLDAAFRLVFNGGWTHSSTGATPNGVNAYADTKLNATGNLSNNNMHLSYYARNYSTSISGRTLMGSVVTASNAAVALNWSSIAPYYYPTMQEFSFPTLPTFPSVLKGLHIGRRINATQETLFINSTKYEATQASNNLIPNNTFYLGSNHALTAQQYNDVECSFSSIGDGLTDTEAANLYSRVQQFQTTLNRQV